ncbi:MAG: DUF448 domain-containing protein [Alphaproteobacteria bacterium]|nr:DUF448 domain-containing protein [Alphaproteobacteria bacterium]
MMTALTQTDSPSVACRHADTARRCLACGTSKPKTSLIRFVIAPDGRLTPDIMARLDGRGFWVSAQRDCLLKALETKAFRRAAKGRAVHVPKDLALQVCDLLGRRCLDLLGLAAKAGLVVRGLPQIEQALRKEQLSFVVFAWDAGADGRKKLCGARGFSTLFPQTVLGAALGQDHVAYAGLLPHALSDKLMQELARYLGVCADEQLLNDKDEIVDGR